MKTAEEWQQQLGYKTITDTLNPFGYSVPKVSLETIKAIQLDALQEAARVVPLEFDKKRILSLANNLTNGGTGKAKYLYIGGAYADSYWVGNPPDEDQWDSWKSGELVIAKVEGEIMYEPDGIDEWKVIPDTSDV